MIEMRARTIAQCVKNDKSQYLRLEDVADRYGVEPATWTRWVKSGHVPCPVRIADLIVWPMRDLIRWDFQRHGDAAWARFEEMVQPCDPSEL
jgi:predicted DNA-binding transcriptional regulator AlpA